MGRVAGDEDIMQAAQLARVVKRVQLQNDAVCQQGKGGGVALAGGQGQLAVICDITAFDDGGGGALQMAVAHLLRHERDVQVVVVHAAIVGGFAGLRAGLVGHVADEGVFRCQAACHQGAGGGAAQQGDAPVAPGLVFSLGVGSHGHGDDLGCARVGKSTESYAFPVVYHGGGFLCCQYLVSHGRFLLSTILAEIKCESPV